MNDAARPPSRRLGRGASTGRSWPERGAGGPAPRPPARGRAAREVGGGAAGLPLLAAGGNARGGGRGARPALPGPAPAAGSPRLAGGSGGRSVGPSVRLLACSSRRGASAGRSPETLCRGGPPHPRSLPSFLPASYPAGERRRLAPP